MGRNEVVISVLSCALLISSNGVDAYNKPPMKMPKGAASNPQGLPRPGMHQGNTQPGSRAHQILRKQSTQTTELRRQQIEQAAKAREMSVKKLERMEEISKKLRLEKMEEAGLGTRAEHEREEHDDSDDDDVQKNSEADVPVGSEFDSFNPLDLFQSLEGTKKTPFEGTADEDAMSNSITSKRDKLSSVFATMLGSMMEVSRGVDESTGTHASAANSCVKGTRNVALSCFKNYNSINEDLKYGRITDDAANEQMGLLRETCADKSRVINTQCVKPIAAMCSEQVQAIKKECAEAVAVGDDVLTLNKALDSASEAAQACAKQASSLLKNCMTQSKAIAPDLSELNMIDSRSEEKALEMQKQREIEAKVQKSMEDLSFATTATDADEIPVKKVAHSSLSKMKLPVVSEEEEEKMPETEAAVEEPQIQEQEEQVVAKAVDETASAPKVLFAKKISTAAINDEEEPVAAKAATATKVVAEPVTEELAEESETGCAGDLSRVTNECNETYKQISARVKAGEIEESVGKEQLAVAARQCVAKTMIATSNCKN